MISSSDSGISSNMSSISLFLCYSLLTTSRKSSINVFRSIGLIDGPKPAITMSYDAVRRRATQFGRLCKVLKFLL